MVNWINNFIGGVLLEYYFCGLKKDSIYTNFVYELKWISTTLFTAFWILHIFVFFFAEFINPKTKGEKLTPEFSQNVFVKT